MILRQKEWEQPSRTDYYIMSLTRTVVELLGNDPGKLDNYKLRFPSSVTQSGRHPAAKTPEQVEWSKQVWMTIGENAGPRPNANK